METIGKTTHNPPYTVMALNPGESSPMLGHKGGEIATDTETRTMYAWGVFVALYGTESIMNACNSF